MMDGINSIIDPREEVKKLQDLVKKLERQNEQLRSKQNNVKENVPQPNGTSDVTIFKTEDNKNDIKKVNCSLDDVDIIDVEALDFSEEDSWLYAAPVTLTPEQKAVNLYEWMRKDLDDVHNVELQMAKKALVNKIAEIERSSPILNRSSSLANLNNNCTSPVSSIKRELPKTPKTPAIKPPLSALGATRVIDSNTFTRARKPVDVVPPCVDQSFEDGMETPNELYFDTEMALPLGTSTPHAVPSSGSNSLASVIDIKALAKLQEESLRQSLSSSRRHSGSASPKLQHSMVPSPLNLSDHESGSPHTLAPGERYFCQGAESPNSQSSAGSPPDSLHGSNQSLDAIRNLVISDQHRRSLPNLIRPTITHQPVSSLTRTSPNNSMMRTHASDSKLTQQRAESPQRSSSPSHSETRMRIPSQLRRPSAPGLSMVRQSSPVRRGTGIPVFRSSTPAVKCMLPQPSSRLIAPNAASVKPKMLPQSSYHHP